MCIRYPAITARQQTSGKPCDQRRQRRAAEAQRRADYARQNAAIAQRIAR